MAGRPQVLVLNAKTQRKSGRQAQLENIAAARAVGDLLRTTLGPRSMLKMLLDPMGGVVVTNDGHCVLREMDLSHPTAKSMLELSRSQEEEVGDGTTSVIVLSAEMLVQAEPFIRDESIHPTVIVQGYAKALHAALDICRRLAITVDIHDERLMSQLVQSTIGTKFSSRWNDIMVKMALQAVLTVANLNNDHNNANDIHASSASTMPLQSFVSSSVLSSTALSEVDLKRYAKVEKIPGGEITDCQVVRGVMFNKEPTHSKMRRRIEHPRILLLDSPLEYKKGESNTHVEITDDQDWNTLLKMEEEYVENMCMEIIAHHPDVVISEKGVSDLAQHYLQKANITAFRRLRKTDNNRIARATGATIVSRTSEIQESDIGTQCGLMEMRKVGDEWFCFLEECQSPKACSIVLRGGSKDVLNEIERNLQDALQVVRNVVYQPLLLPGGGATEMAVAVGLRQVAAQQAQGLVHGPFLAVAQAMEVIPRTLAENCGVSVLRTVTQLRAKHAAAYTTTTPTDAPESAGAVTAGADAPLKEGDGLCYWGINGVMGELVDMQEYGIWEPLSVKVQTIKTAIESACMILRIDDIVSGSKRK